MRQRTSALLVAAMLALAGCAGGDEAEEAVTPTAPATSTPAAQPTEAEQTEPADQSQQKTRTYRVKRGDSLSEIAAKFNTTVRELVRLNDIKDKHHIREGQKLKIPAGG